MYSICEAALSAGVSSLSSIFSIGSSFSVTSSGASTFLNSLNTVYTASTSSLLYSPVTSVATSRAIPRSTRASTFTYSPANFIPTLRKTSRPFFPIGIVTIFFPGLLRKKSAARFRILVLNAPASPLSPDSTITRMRSSGLRASKGCCGDSTRAIVERSTRASSFAYGRAASAASCALRSRAADTNFIARVICWVFFTERMRRRKSSKVGIFFRYRMISFSVRRRRYRRHEAVLECVDSGLDVGFNGVIQRLFRRHLFQHGGVVGLDKLQEFALEPPDLLHRNGVQRPARGHINRQHLLLDRQRHKLVLLQHFRQPLAPRQLRLRYLVQLVGSELRKRRQVAELRHVQAQCARHLSHRLDLRVASHAAYRNAHVNRRADACVEQVGFQVNLSVGDRNHVGWNVGGHVARLRFDHRQRGERSATQLVVQFCRPFEQARVKIEHVPGVRFASRWTPQQKRNLAVCLCVLRKVVVKRDRVPFVVAKVFAHRAGRIRRNVLQRCRLRRRRRHHNRVIQGAGIGQDLHHLRDRRALLPDRTVDADHV